MKILLVNPPRYLGKIPVIREDRCEITERYSVIFPYSLIWIASILRDRGHMVKLIDANALNISYIDLRKKLDFFEYESLIFRFTPTTFNWDIRTAQISKEFNSDLRTIGICLTLRHLQREVMEKANHLDFFVPQEWEIVIPELVESLEKDNNPNNVKGISYRKDGKIIVNPPAEPIKDYDSLPIPAYELLPDLKLYRPNTPVNGNYAILYASKGCPYGCIYCTVSRSPFKIKSADKVMKELRLLNSKYNVKIVSFFDETFTIDKKRTIKISKIIKDEGLDIKWYCNTRVNLVDKKLLKIMYEGGCRGIAYGIESGSQKILDNAKKEITIDESKKAIKWTKEAGIKAYASFIFGLPGENWKTIRQTNNFVKETLPNSAQFNVAVPYPGSELYDFAVRRGLISNTDWNDLYQHKALMRTEELTTEDLEKARKLAYRALYFNPRWIFSNVCWILREPMDLGQGVKYYLKALKNYSMHRMEHAH